jgi:hypothetical protein
MVENDEAARNYGGSLTAHQRKDKEWKSSPFLTT